MRGRRDGLGETLSRLRTRGINVGVLSDYARVEERLARLAIDPALFDSLASAESAGALKPAPRPFLEMCSAWGIDPGETLVVGDRFDTDGAAAKSAGMQFLKIGDKKGPLGEGRSWTAIKSYLNEL
jgi:HAD superfamily hydrolase (TIGR01549 family)